MFRECNTRSTRDSIGVDAASRLHKGWDGRTDVRPLCLRGTEHNGTIAVQRLKSLLRVSVE